MQTLLHINSSYCVYFPTLSSLLRLTDFRSTKQAVLSKIKPRAFPRMKRSLDVVCFHTVTPRFYNVIRVGISLSALSMDAIALYNNNGVPPFFASSINTIYSSTDKKYSVFFDSLITHCNTGAAYQSGSSCHVKIVSMLKHPRLKVVNFCEITG